LERFVEILISIKWYLVLQLIGLAALPLALRLFRHLPGKGYGFARALGLLVAGWIFWLLSIFGWLPNTSGSVLVALVLLAAFGLGLWSISKEKLDLGQVRWRYVLTVELIFLVAFAAWCIVRSHMPRIQTAGGEKWMEIAFLNSVLRAPRFPPQDPWLSGFAISYYYFGYIIIGMIARLAGATPTIGFNLGVATLFALVCVGAYGLVYNLLAAEKRREALWGGLFGPLLVVLTGNLEGLLEVLHSRGFLSASFWRWLDIRSINVPPPSLTTGSWVPTRFFWWWQASRVIHDTAPWHNLANPQEYWEVIDEFPAFSFLLGDMHPHVLALPFVLLAVALALALFLRKNTHIWKTGSIKVELPLRPWEFCLYAICLGGLGFLNTWDFPIYLFVVAGAYGLAQYRRRAKLNWGPLFYFTVTLAASGFLFYLPFWAGFQSQASGILPNLLNGTRLPQFLVMFAPLLFPVCVLVFTEARRRGVTVSRVLLWFGVVVLMMLLVFAVAAFVMPQGRQYTTAWLNGDPIPGLEHIPNGPTLIGERLLERVLSPWTPVGLSVLLVVAGLAALSRESVESDPLPKETVDLTGLVLLFVVTGLLLTLAVEFVYLQDIFRIRMNTVFKFYFQAWVLWGVAGAYALVRSMARGKTWTIAALLLVIAGLVYLALAIPSRWREYGGPVTLDGADHLRRSRSADFAAIEWLNENIEGTTVILEAPGDNYAAYVYSGRVSAFTGLPTLLGWGGHQHQWRGNYNEPAVREPDIERLYSTEDVLEAIELLEQYNVEYVYIGPEEWDRYPASGLAKFSQLSEVVYDANGVVIYRYVPGSEGLFHDYELERSLPGQGVP
jgi:YYY domain-containing protein